jgi:hypothetical protein
MSPRRTSLTSVLGGPPSCGREDSHISLVTVNAQRFITRDARNITPAGAAGAQRIITPAHLVHGTDRHALKTSGSSHALVSGCGSAVARRVTLRVGLSASYGRALVAEFHARPPTTQAMAGRPPGHPLPRLIRGVVTALANRTAR